MVRCSAVLMWALKGWYYLRTERTLILRSQCEIAILNLIPIQTISTLEHKYAKLILNFQVSVVAWLFRRKKVQRRWKSILRVEFFFQRETEIARTIVSQMPSTPTSTSAAGIGSRQPSATGRVEDIPPWIFSPRTYSPRSFPPPGQFPPT